jgi:hypothetical protein
MGDKKVQAAKSDEGRRMILLNNTTHMRILFELHTSAISQHVLYSTIQTMKLYESSTDTLNNDSKHP